MAQIDDLRKQQANHEERISKLEALINPLSKDLQEAAAAKAVENLLDDAPDAEQPDPPQTADAPMTVTITGETLPPPPIITGDTKPEDGMGIIASGNGQQPSVSEGNEEPKE